VIAGWWFDRGYSESVSSKRKMSRHIVLGKYFLFGANADRDPLKPASKKWHGECILQIKIYISWR